MWSEPNDGTADAGWFLVGVERSGGGWKIRVVEEQSSIAAHAFQLVVVGRLVVAATTDAAAGQSSSSVHLLIRPIPSIQKEFSVIFIVRLSLIKSN